MSSTKQVVKVGIADLNITTAPHSIRTSGLGSCVGCVIYDPVRKIAGLAHIMLPDSSLSRQTKMNDFKYADTALPILVDQLVSAGARKTALKAKIAGGAQMFKFNSQSDMMRIGPRNTEAVICELKKMGIPLIASDTGGNCGRTIEFFAETGDLHIRTVSKGESIL
ncbi:chemotaxis protein CheD [Aciduricibacillus chroicocephali]|uniref:Probable chemoreceptor glutamine deamidase CheD n=1 Tax=Aciduricibacillus chroicocephali TaxID=3054939 RepID=A0ABY9KY30_9BACI|nr:chemotaxis protein CheD [Bacillaceae bacterium 44XB]